MRIKPIPLNLLIHNVEYLEIVESNGWDDEFNPPLPIENVRVEPSEYVNRTTNSSGTSSKNILFVDRFYSNPYPEFKVKSKIIWNDEEYEISKVNKLYDVDPNEPHHYELELV